jgi:hypothetical protein
MFLSSEKKSFFWLAFLAINKDPTVWLDSAGMPKPFYHSPSRGMQQHSCSRYPQREYVCKCMQNGQLLVVNKEFD